MENFQFKPQASQTLSNAGGIEIMLSDNNSKVYYRFVYNPFDTEPEIFEADVIDIDELPCFRHGSDVYELKNFMTF